MPLYQKFVPYSIYVQSLYFGNKIYIIPQHIHVSMIWNRLYVLCMYVTKTVWNYIFIVNLYTNLKVIAVLHTHFSTLPRQPITPCALALILKPTKWHAGKLYKSKCGEACMVVSLFFPWFQHWAFSHCEDSEPQKKMCKSDHMVYQPSKLIVSTYTINIQTEGQHTRL